MPKIISISTGQIKSLNPERATGANNILSAIVKTPVSSLAQPLSVEVGTLGIAGDEQADMEVHGGIEKAVYVYPIEHYEFWQTTFVQMIRRDPTIPLAHGFFGENLTVQGFLESEVFLGDRWFIGKAIFQVAKLREPCFKFNIKTGFKGAAKAMIQTGNSGWYLRVLHPGVIQAGDLIRVEPGAREISIADQNRTLYRLKGQSSLDF